MKKLFTLLICLGATLAQAQFKTTFNIDANQENKPISPLIYGINMHPNSGNENITARRLGGDRLTGYNWENNFSNGGSYANNTNDAYLPWYFKLPQENNNWLTPNLVIKAFHDVSLATNCYSLITLPMAGYVAADKNGSIALADAAPSLNRLKQVKNEKGSEFSLIPNTADNYVYVDECLNNLITQYGLSTTANGIKAYSMDNEYALWSGTHPRIHPAQPTITEVLEKSKALAATIKKMDSHAEVYGPADYGFNSYYNFQNAPDWATYKADGVFINTYLREMKAASDAAGKRLLDVLDMHWYPEAKGENDLHVFQRVTTVNNTANDRGVAEARMQSPRTLWDPSYVEHSWIGQSFSPCVYLTNLKASIDKYYPGTKLAFTEFNYGGMNHISGGIATADVLGLFGKYGVYAAMHWEALEQYYSAAYKIYRNYDGKKATFGDIGIKATSNDYAMSSIYASLNSKNLNEMHIIAMNKNYDSSLEATFNITANSNFSKMEVYRFDKDSYEITKINELPTIVNNTFIYTIPPLSVYHFVLQAGTVAVPQVGEPGNNKQNGDLDIIIYPNPSDGIFNIRLGDQNLKIKALNILDITGKEIFKSMDVNTLKIDLSKQASGVYFVSIETENGLVIRKIIKQ